MKGAICAITVGALLGGQAVAHINGKTMKAKLYKVAFSTSPRCTNPVTVYENDNADYLDFLQNPVFGQRVVPDGTYSCVIVEISNIIRVIPEKNSATCLASKEVIQNVCLNNQPRLAVRSLEGHLSPCDEAEGRVAIYLSTASLKTDPLSPEAEPFLPPILDAGDPGHGIKLPHPIVVKGRATGTLTLSAEGRVNDDEKVCRIETPAIRFE
jgi:hypothetical protein